MVPAQVGQLSGVPLRSRLMRPSACAGLYVFGRGLRIDSLPDSVQSSAVLAESIDKLRRLNRNQSSVIRIAGAGLIAIIASGCGPHARVPIRPETLASALAPTDSGSVLARRLAPILYLQLDETFPLERVVAVLHPRRRIIAYHLLWRDDVHGAWIPFTVPTDEELLWVGYDGTGAPTDLWTYWHGRILHTPWNRSQVAADVQWGKHGTLPRGTLESDLPRMATLSDFYALTIIAAPDILLGDLSRKGPRCFCHSYARYRDFARPLLLSSRIDAVARTEDPREVLKAVFGARYSNKLLWPPER